MSQERMDYFKPGTEAGRNFARIDLSRLPTHVAVIMDGNGRWARKRNLPRVEGHRAGSKSVREVVEAAAHLGVRYLTLYAFSRENWKRPKVEVSTLWTILVEYLRRDDKVLVKNNIRLKVIGRIEELPSDVRTELERVVRLTAGNTGLTVQMALSYGGRTEILDAVKKLFQQQNCDIESLDEERFADMLYSEDVPDPDLLIRSSGELRISNFLLWQIAYTEIWVTPELWPDFRRQHFLEAVIDYQSRNRRFGGISSQDE